MGPDHPQIEIYMESKHGDIYTAFGDEYNWKAAPGTWSPGVDFRRPTCASCHMSVAGSVLTSHDVTERLSWELQAPLTVRPEEFKAFPAKTKWQTERDKMKQVCIQCHGKTWVDDHYVKMDKVVAEYNDVYFKPAKNMLDDLYAKGLPDKARFFDERLEDVCYLIAVSRPIRVQYPNAWYHVMNRGGRGQAIFESKDDFQML